MYTTQIVRRVLSGSILRTVSLFSTVAISFFMMPFLVQSLGDAHYGIWVVVGSIMGFYGFFDLGLATAVGRYISNAVGKEDYDEVNQIVNTAFVLFTILGLVVILLSCVGAGIVYTLPNVRYGSTFAILFIILGINIGLQFPLRTFSGVLTSLMRFDLLVFVEMFRLFMRTVLIVILISQGYGVVMLAVISLLTQIAGSIIEFRLVRNQAGFIVFSRKLFHFPIVKQLALYSWAAFLTNVCEMARLKMLPIMVTGYFGLNYVVLYSIALRLVEYFELLMRNCIGFMMPVLSRFDGESNNGLVEKTFHYLTIFSISIAVFIGMSIYFYGEPFIRLWMGSHYVDSYQILLILLLPTMLMSMQIPSKDLLFAMSKHKGYALLSLGEVMGILAAAYIFTDKTNLISLAYAVVIGVTCFELVKPYYVAKALNKNLSQIYMMYIWTVLRTVGILVLFKVTILRHYLINSYFDIIMLGTVQLIFFGTVCYFLVIPQQLRTLLQSTVIGPIIRKIQTCCS